MHASNIHFFSPYNNYTDETETDITVCSIDDENYKEGEAFYPKNTCLKCICQKGFNGTLVEPFCKKQVCGIQLRHSKSLAQNCAPLYLGRSTCCPLDFICRKYLFINSSGTKTRTDL